MKHYFWWLLLSGCIPAAPPPIPPPDPVSLLHSELADERLQGFFLMDRDAMGANVGELLRLAKEDPSERNRREITRQLGYCGDPVVIDYLVASLDTELRDEAAESLGYLGPVGCRVLAEQWVQAERNVGHIQDVRLERALSMALGVWAPECLAELARFPDQPENSIALMRGREFYVERR